MEEAQRRIDEWVREGDNTKELSLYNLGLTSLPPLPERLTCLNCRNNKLPSLPPLPEGLTKLFCSDNQLTSLPALPEGLTYLYCTVNVLTSLPPLPESLTALQCSGNHIFYPPKDKIDQLSLTELKEWMCENPYNLVKSANKH